MHAFFDRIARGGRVLLTALPNTKRPGRTKKSLVDTADMALQFARTSGGPDVGIFFAVARLQEGIIKRSLETATAIPAVWADVDFKQHPNISVEEVDRRLREMRPQASAVVNSGGGRHVYWFLREDLDVGSETGRREATELLQLACRHVGGDPAVCEVARLMRLPGSVNTRYGDVRDVSLLLERAVEHDTPELADAFREAAPVLPEPVATPKANGHDHTARTAGYSGPVDVEAMLAAMAHNDRVSNVNVTHNRVTASLLGSGVVFEDVVEQVFAATRQAAADGRVPAGWDWALERRIIESHVYRFINKFPGHEAQLPDHLYRRWQEIVDAGDKPSLWHDRSGTVAVRAFRKNKDEPTATNHANEPRAPKEEEKIRFKLTPLHELQLDLDEQTYLVDELIPIAGLVDIWGKAKAYKSFFAFDLMLHVGMGWEYRDRQVQQGAVIYCAFEGAHGYRSRKAAAFKHYEIADGVQVPLHVMSGNVNLIKEHRLLIRDFQLQLNGVIPRAVVLDTLNKSLVGSESSDEDMGNYVRAAEAIRDAFGCVVIIVHHCGYDDTHPRGHTSLPGAVDAQLKVAKIDDTTFTVTVEMMRDGPEEIEIVSQVKTVDLGEGPNGKQRTSLVVIPGDAAAGGHRGWPRSMTVFFDALHEALRRHGEPFQAVLGTPPEQAVDMEKLRACFYGQYPVDGDTEEKRQAARRQAFNRDLKNARNAKLIGARVIANGKTMVWTAA